MSVKNNENRPGYKKTTLGWIPEEWETNQIGKVCRSIVPGRNKPKTFSGSIPWITTPEITQRRIPTKLQAHFVNEQEIKESGAKIVPHGSVVFVCVGDLGITAITKGEVVLNQQLHAFVCPEYIQNEYLAYWLEEQKPYMFRVASATTIPYLNKANCESIPLVYPPLPEQKAIAEVLTVWDRAIEKTERLIQAKEKRFKGLLQTLINPANKSGWQKVKLGELFGKQLIVEKGTPLIKDNTQAGNIPVVAGGQTYAYYHNEATHTGSCITISASGAYAGFVWLHDYPIWASDCNVIYAKTGSTPFFYYVLKSQQHQIYSLQAGGAQPHVYAKDLKNLIVPLPPILEQKRIAETLNLAQREIDLLKKLAEKQKLQKRGLMQKLLTGEWRVKPEARHA